MKRFIIGLTIAGFVFAGVFAFASSLSVSTSSLQAGNAAVGQCDTDGVSVSFAAPSFTNGTGFTVNSVNVSGINQAACGGKTVYVTVTDGSTNALSSGSAAIPAGAGTSFSTPVGLASAVSAANVLDAHVAIS